ncbi:MAG: HAD-IA family hydrolase [Rhodospirillaceae bacterium]
MSARALKLVIFDCEGTLVDSQLAVVSAMTAAWRALGLDDPDPILVRRVISLPLKEAINALLPTEDPLVAKRLAGLFRDAFYREHHQDGHQREPLFSGMREVLEALRATGCKLGIATGKSRQGLLTTLEDHGILDWFVTLQTADCCDGKPAPDMVYRALEESGVAAADSVVIGDTTYDIEMALAAGVPSIGVAWGYHEVRDLKAAGAGRIVYHCGEIIPAVLDVSDVRR